MGSILAKKIDSEVQKAGTDFQNVNPLALVITFEGYECERIIYEDGYLEKPDGENDIVLYYGKCPEVTQKIISRQCTEEDYSLYCPVVVLFDVERIVAKHIYPFNPKRMPEAVKNVGWGLEDYALGNTLEGIQKYIFVFYRTSRNYLDGVTRGEEGTETNSGGGRNSCFDIIRELHQGWSLYEGDQTISVLTEERINICDCIKGIILPEKLMAYEAFRQLTTKEGLLVKTYPTKRHRAPTTYGGEVADLCRECMDLLEVRR